MRTNFVLIDSENVKPQYLEKLNRENFRVFIFVGPNQKRLEFTMVNALQSFGSNGNYVQLSSRGPNALDFHIAYYIGKLSAAHPDAYFHIISKDKGFDPLIQHLKVQKISCCRAASVMDIRSLRPAQKLTAKQRAEDFYKKRIASTKARPAKLTSLQSSILSHFNKTLTEKEVADVVAALMAAGHVVVNGTKVSYPNCN